MTRIPAATDDARTTKLVAAALALAMTASLATMVRHPDLFLPMQEAESGLPDSGTVVTAMQSP